MVDGAECPAVGRRDEEMAGITALARRVVEEAAAGLAARTS
jgi:hypothetical protein